MKESKGTASPESTRMQEFADSLLAEAMKLPGVADYLSVYGEYQKFQTGVACYFATLRSRVSWNTSDTTTL